jgi:hypothetical protein
VGGDREAESSSFPELMFGAGQNKSTRHIIPSPASKKSLSVEQCFRFMRNRQAEDQIVLTQSPGKGHPNRETPSPISGSFSATPIHSVPHPKIPVSPVGKDSGFPPDRGSRIPSIETEHGTVSQWN